MRVRWLQIRGGRALLLSAALLLVLLVALGLLQYHWVGQISEADRVRLKAGARSRAEDFCRDFDRELTRAFLWLQVTEEIHSRHNWPLYAERRAHWLRSSPYPRMVAQVFFAERAASGSLSLARFDETHKVFAPTEWPAAWAPLRTLFQQSDLEKLLGQRSPSEFISVEEPLLIAPLTQIQMRSSGPAAIVSSMQLAGLTLISFDFDYLRQTVFPELAQGRFRGEEGLSYSLWVVNEDNPRRVLYSSEPNQPAPAASDASAGLFRLRFDDVRAGDWPPIQGPESESLGANARREPRRFPFPRRLFGGRRGFGELGQWRLLAAHKAGSLDQVVAAAQRRNLVVGLSILGLLAASMTLIVISAQNARRLMERQLEFVAAVSHELRTPVSVIVSAGENLADGVVRDGERVRQYGGMVRDEGRRLGEQIEQVLAFASSLTDRGVRHEPVAVEALVREALQACNPLLQAGGFAVQVEVQPELPCITGERGALRRALINLIENAVKYSGESRTVRVAAQRVVWHGETTVAIAVEDHGQGIPAAERRAIFEPFFRGREAVQRQIHGSGLGLSLVQRIVKAHQGSIEVDSEEGRGSRFTLLLPAATPPAAAEGCQ